MANATVKKTGESIKVTLNDEASKFGFPVELIKASQLVRSHSHTGTNVTELYISNNEKLYWTHDSTYTGQEALIVYSIDAGDGAGAVVTDTATKLMDQIDKMMQ